MYEYNRFTFFQGTFYLILISESSDGSNT